MKQVCLKYYEYEFMELACQCPAVVCCRCAPTQKAQIVRLLQERTGKLTCAVGRKQWLHSLSSCFGGFGFFCILELQAVIPSSTYMGLFTFLRAFPPQKPYMGLESLGRHAGLPSDGKIGQCPENVEAIHKQASADLGHTCT